VIFLDKWFKLNLAKKLLNPAVRVLNILIPEREPAYPQTKILARVYADLLHVYKIEAKCGRFDDIPYGTLDTLKDKNFLRFLQLSGKVLTYLGDTDRYYRQWLGLFMLLMHDHIQSFQEGGLISEVALHLINDQWDYGLPEDNDFLLGLFSKNKRLATQIVLANQLPNLVTLTLNRGDRNHEHSTNRS
jgi:hypothetical protein